MEIRKHLESFGQSRRWFMQIGAASVFVSRLGAQAAEASENVFGPRPGYSPQIGTLVSEMIWMRGAVLATVKGLNQNQLDFLLDNKANRIGALLLHLAATEKLYQLNTFENVPAHLCKWFHVCEHESHHTGQIAMLKSRADAKPRSAG